MLPLSSETSTNSELAMLSYEERLKIMAENPPEIYSIHWGSAYFDWGWKGCGFGQLDFRISEDGTIRVANEYMSRDKVRAIFDSACQPHCRYLHS